MAAAPDRPDRPQPPGTAARRRLLLRVSTRRDVEAGLETSVTLAVALRGELSALFVEEEAPIGACSLPFPTMLTFSGHELAMDSARIEAALRREAEACRRLLSAAAERARLAWSFRAGRGEALRLLREASGEGDILVLGLDRIGLPAWELLAAARSLAPRRGGILILPALPAPRHGILLTLGCASQPADALRPLAAELAQALETGWSHLAIGDDPEPGMLGAQLAQARLLLARLESPLLDEPQMQRRLGAALRRPLLLLRTADEG